MDTQTDQPEKALARLRVREYEAEEGEDCIELKETITVNPSIARGMPRRSTYAEDDEMPVGALAEGAEEHLRAHTAERPSGVANDPDHASPMLDADEIFFRARDLLHLLPRGLRDRTSLTPGLIDHGNHGGKQGGRDDTRKRDKNKGGWRERERESREARAREAAGLPPLNKAMPISSGSAIGDALSDGAGGKKGEAVGSETERPNFWVMMEDYFRPVEAEDIGMCLQLDPRVDPSFFVPASGRHYTLSWAQEDCGDADTNLLCANPAQLNQNAANSMPSGSTTPATGERRGRKRSMPAHERTVAATAEAPKSFDEHSHETARHLLNSCQELELAALVKQTTMLLGRTITEVAQESGVDKDTLQDWLEGECAEEGATAFTGRSTHYQPGAMASAMGEWLRTQAANPIVSLHTAAAAHSRASTNCFRRPFRQDRARHAGGEDTTAAPYNAGNGCGAAANLPELLEDELLLLPRPLFDVHAVQPSGTPAPGVGISSSTDAEDMPPHRQAPVVTKPLLWCSGDVQHLLHSQRGAADLPFPVLGIQLATQEAVGPALGGVAVHRPKLSLATEAVGVSLPSDEHASAALPSPHGLIVDVGRNKNLAPGTATEAASPPKDVSTETRQHRARGLEQGYHTWEAVEVDADEFIHPFTQAMLADSLSKSSSKGASKTSNNRDKPSSTTTTAQGRTEEAKEPSASTSIRTGADVSSKAPHRLAVMEKEKERCGRAPGGGTSWRCSVCLVQKKGRCGTETAPAKCLRRAGASTGASHAAEAEEGDDIAAARASMKRQLERLRSEASTSRATTPGGFPSAELVALAPSDEVTGELLSTQWELLQLLTCNRRRLRTMLQRLLPALPAEEAHLSQDLESRSEVERYLGKLREARRMLKRERREREQAAQAAAAHAAAAASTRVSHAKREAGQGSEEGTSRGQLAGKKGRPACAYSDTSSDTDQELLVDHLVNQATNEEEAVCVVCGNGDSEVPNEIVNCEKCGLWVHQQCYAIKEIPEGEWLCWPCKADLDPDAIKCAICPVRRGAFKKSTCGNWVHVVCAHWMPEVTVLDEDCDIAIDGVQAIPRERSRLTCHVCNRKEGACLQCNFGHCPVAFHPLCARSAGSFVNVRRDAGTGSTVFCAYCDKHSQMQRERLRAKGRVAELPCSLPGVSLASLPAPKPLETMQLELERFRRLRGDFERLRLLCERVVKRERLKSELSTSLCQMAKVRLVEGMPKPENSEATPGVSALKPILMVDTSPGTEASQSTNQSPAGDSGSKYDPGDLEEFLTHRIGFESTVGQDEVSTLGTAGVQRVGSHTGARTRREGTTSGGGGANAGVSSSGNATTNTSTSAYIGAWPGGGWDSRLAGTSSMVEDVARPGKAARLGIERSLENRVRVDRECFMTSGEAEVTNSRLPKGYLYVPLDAFTNKER